jgi:hypothetical protein
MVTTPLLFVILSVRLSHCLTNHLNINRSRFFQQPVVQVGDACWALCYHISAFHTGYADDLCDNSNPSSCENTLCTFLYWSTTEDGNPGLIYDSTGSTLTPEEREQPLTCSQASHINQQIRQNLIDSR